MITGPGLAIILAFVLSYYVGIEAVRGVRWAGHEAKKAGHAIVHVLKKVR